MVGQYIHPFWGAASPGLHTFFRKVHFSGRVSGTGVSPMGKRPGVLVFRVLRDHLSLGIGWTDSPEDGKPFRGIYYYVF